MRAAVYYRSSADRRQGERERQQAIASVESRGWKVTEVYVESAMAGGRERGPELIRMLADAWRARFDVIVVRDLANLVRSSRDLVRLLRQCAQAHVRLVAVRGGFDTAFGAGEASLRTAELLAKLDREIHADHVRDGLAKAREAGRRIGRPPRQMDLGALKQLRGRGQSIREIARALGVSSSTVARRLKASLVSARAVQRVAP